MLKLLLRALHASFGGHAFNHTSISRRNEPRQVSTKHS
ncbi:MAG: hypothetical protein AVDCRST_MAG14-776 [uncultured Rubrobacteraceae bacterium]|uniref:Uncharacterized protein n=1 Tax=uncultured Rubrobacteraceae bacterium TaxID=349277 RepID=A0A6J4QPL9_9ACTN|nr:MAG: hypothetical protein AVDCRST_MAG14-776 [uncultured Rubrobacteraceae bacterium]